MDWRRIPHAEGYEMSESGDVRRADGLLVPYYRLLWGGVTRSCRRKRYDPRRFCDASVSVEAAHTGRCTCARGP